MQSTLFMHDIAIRLEHCVHNRFVVEAVDESRQLLLIGGETQVKFQCLVSYDTHTVCQQ